MPYTFLIKKKNLLASLLLVSNFFYSDISAQTTSWKGVTSNAWATATNWTNGVPTALLDVVIGDANFTGSFQPSVTATSVAKSLTIGTGTIPSTLTETAKLTVSGNVTIGANGTLALNSVTTATGLILTGNFSNSGIFSTVNTNALVTFSGVTQSISGTSATTFRQLTISSGTTTLNQNITVTTLLTVTGTLDPNEPTYTVTLTGASFTLNAASTLKVKASTFAGNYSIEPTTVNATSTIDYAAASIDQTVSNGLTYGNLKISGTTTKTPNGNLTVTGNLTITGGTYDLSNYTSGRNAAGGTITVSNSCTLNIGSANTFPANYTTKTLGATSTVKYSGTNQTVTAATYGNLILSSSSGAVVKSFSASAMTVAGNLTTTLGSGTSVTVNTGAAITVTGNLNIGASTTFNGSSFSHPVAGNFTNDGTFSSTTGTVTLSGASKTISGTGTTTFYNLTITGAGITVPSSVSFSVAGNFLTSGAGTLTHTTGGSGTITMSGAAKTIAGTGASFNNLTISGTISTAVALIIPGDLTVSNSFTSTAALTLSGSSNSISGAGATLSLSSLTVSGTYSCSRNISLSSNLTVTGTFTASAGTVTFTGTSILSGTANLFNATLNGTSLTLSTNAILGIAGTFIKTAGVFNVTTNTPNTVNYNAGGAQPVAAINYNNLTLSNSGIKNFASGTLMVANNFTISGTATINASTNTSTFTFNGSGAQTLTSNGNSFYNLTISNSAGVTLADDLTISSVLSLSTGKITTGSNRVICTSTASGAIINHGSSSYIDENLRRYIANNNSTYTFPVGTVTAYTLEELINNNLTGISYIDASFGAKPGTDVGLNVWENGTYYTSVNTFGVWYLTPNANPSGGTYDLKCYTNAFSGLVDNAFGILSRPDASSNAAQWIKAGGTLNATNGLGRLVSDGYALRKGLTSFSQKGIGQAGQGLPIELTFFDVTKENQNTILNWATASEMNNNRFEIESGVTDATGNLSFTKIGEVAGMGTTTVETHYQFTDAKNNFSGIVYYRLKQVDENGEFTYSAIKSVEFAAAPFTVSDFYPNPANDNFSFEINSATVTAITVKVVNSVGQLVMQKNFYLEQGFNNQNMNIEKLPAGLYFVEITDQNNSVIQKRKIIKN